MEGGAARRHTLEGDVSLVVRSDKPLCAPTLLWTLRALFAPLWILRRHRSTHRPTLAVSTQDGGLHATAADRARPTLAKRTWCVVGVG